MKPSKHRFGRTQDIQDTAAKNVCANINLRHTCNSVLNIHVYAWVHVNIHKYTFIYACMYHLLIYSIDTYLHTIFNNHDPLEKK